MFQNSKKKQSKKEAGVLSSIGSLFFIIILVFAFKSSILDANNIPSGSMIPTLKIGDFLFVNKMRYSFRMPFTEREIYRFDDPKRGDIVTFIPPNAAIYEDYSGNSIQNLMIRMTGVYNMFAKRFVKRVVGMPGDTIRVTKIQLKNIKNEPVGYTLIEYKENSNSEFKNYNPLPIPSKDELKGLDNVKSMVGKSLFLEDKREFKHFVLEGYSESIYPFADKHCNKPEGCLIPEKYYMVMGDNRDDSSDSRFWGFVKREDILGKALIIYFSINWKDFTCRYKESGSDESYRIEEYSGNELYKHCNPTELEGNIMNESVFQWLFRTVQYRIWRMDIRWERIGRILQ